MSDVCSRKNSLFLTSKLPLSQWSQPKAEPRPDKASLFMIWYFHWEISKQWETCSLQPAHAESWFSAKVFFYCHPGSWGTRKQRPGRKPYLLWQRYPWRKSRMRGMLSVCRRKPCSNMLSKKIFWRGFNTRVCSTFTLFFVWYFTSSFLEKVPVWLGKPRGLVGICSFCH